jgi:hypothetical protein
MTENKPTTPSEQEDSHEQSPQPIEPVFDDSIQPVRAIGQVETQDTGTSVGQIEEIDAQPTADKLDDAPAAPTSAPKSTTHKTVIIIAYWAIACLVLLICIGIVAILSLPIINPSESTSTSTPNITQTLQAAILTAEPPTPTASPSPVPSATLTQRPTTTPLPTHTPSITLSPTSTGTVTPIPPPPTLTPGRPPEDPETLEIAEWLPEDFDYVIRLAEDYPNTLPQDQRGPNNRDYYGAYRYAIMLQGEALLAYPTAFEADNWRWGQAYYLARTSNPQAAVQYAAPINQAYNTEGVRIGNLEGWIRQNDPRLWLEVSKWPAIGENISNVLLKLNAEGGSAYLWSVETEQGTTVYPLSSEFDFPERMLPDHYWSDITRDGIEELVIHRPDASIREIRFPRVFDLSQTPPQELNFKPNQDFDIGLENEYLWDTVVGEEGGEDLRYTATVYPPCPVTIYHTYHWNGLWIERNRADYAIRPVPGIVSYCELVINQAAWVWGAETAIPLMETLLPDWPPQGDSEPRSYPADGKDEWRYRLGIYYALTGNTTTANEYFQDLIDTPTIPGSRWIEPAREFQRRLDSLAGIYQACIPDEFCNERVALQNLVAAIPSNAAHDTLYYLTNAGVAVRYTHDFDFEGDGIPERYITFRHHPDQKLEFWIIAEKTFGAEKESGPEALFVDTVDVSQPTLRRYVTREDISLVWLNAQQSFSLERFQETDEVYIIRYAPSYFYADYTLATVDSAVNALLSGAFALPIRDELAELRRSENFACLTDNDCAYFYYVLGLANELGQDEEGAVNNYLLIWEEYPNTPFAQITRLKLTFKPGFSPPPTFTPTPTITNTPTKTPTNTVTPTYTITPGPSPTPTDTPTPTQTYTPGPSPTPTDTHTPGPSPTPTSTPTPTPTNTDTPTPTETETATPTPTDT